MPPTDDEIREAFGHAKFGRIFEHGDECWTLKSNPAAWYTEGGFTDPLHSTDAALREARRMGFGGAIDFGSHGGYRASAYLLDADEEGSFETVEHPEPARAICLAMYRVLKGGGK